MVFRCLKNSGYAAARNIVFARGMKSGEDIEHVPAPYIFLHLKPENSRPYMHKEIASDNHYQR